MRFEEIGVKDESELEQDDFSLSRSTFGKDNQLMVIGWTGVLRNHKYYVVKCSECSKDSELFGDGIFRIFKDNLKVGNLPCGCALNPKWTEDQYKIRANSTCKEKGYIFHGFAEEFKGTMTKLKLECPKHGIWSTNCLMHLLNKGSGCPSCHIENLKMYNITRSSISTPLKFMSTGKFKEGTKFWRSEKIGQKGNLPYWFSSCPICSNDEYVKNGLCSGVFESHRGELLKGCMPCRCSTSYSWTQDQYEYRIKKKMLESKTTDEFVGFINGFKNQKSKFTRKCLLHGEYETLVSGYLNANTTCPCCANQNQKECYINLIKDNNSVIALKFGIAKDSEQRVKQHNYKSIFEVEQYGIWQFPTVKSCKAAERHIKNNLPCRFLTKEEMPDGYTETTSGDNLKTIIKIYEDFGGYPKLIKDIQYK